jgi:hypothetical protein
LVVEVEAVAKMPEIDLPKQQKSQGGYCWDYASSPKVWYEEAASAEAVRM